MDFNSANRTRTEKTSVAVIKEIFANRQLPAVTYDPDDEGDDSGANNIKFSIIPLGMLILYLFMFV